MLYIEEEDSALIRCHEIGHFEHKLCFADTVYMLLERHMCMTNFKQYIQ